MYKRQVKSQEPRVQEIRDQKFGAKNARQTAVVKCGANKVEK